MDIFADRKKMAPFLHQLKMINKQKPAESLNSLGHHLPESVNLFAICSCLYMHLRVAVTELMVWSRGECAGDTHVMPLCSTGRHITSNDTPGRTRHSCSVGANFH